MSIIHICGPQYRAFWKDSTGKPWWMDWTHCGPIFSENAFQDGGCDWDIVPDEILEASEDWSLKVRSERIICSRRNRMQTEEWKKRYIARMCDCGVDPDLALMCYEACEPDYEASPEDCADNEMSYWTD